MKLIRDEHGESQIGLLAIVMIVGVLISVAFLTLGFIESVKEERMAETKRKRQKFQEEREKKYERDSRSLGGYTVRY